MAYNAQWANGLGGFMLDAAAHPRAHDAPCIMAHRFERYTDTRHAPTKPHRIVKKMFSYDALVAKGKTSPNSAAKVLVCVY